MTATTVFFGAKGGVGTTLCACAAALRLAKDRQVLLVDAAGGDTALMLGLPPGTNGPITDTLHLAHCSPADVERTASRRPSHHVVVDAGRQPVPQRLGTAVLVVRNDYLAIAHALHQQPDQIIAITSTAGRFDRRELTAVLSPLGADIAFTDDHQLAHEFDRQVIDLTATQYASNTSNR